MKITLSGMLLDVLHDLSEPGVVWQIGTLLISIAISWHLARLAQRKLLSAETIAQGLRLGSRSIVYFLTALFSLVLVAVAKPVLMQWHSVNVLRASLSFLLALSLLRFVLLVMQPLIISIGWIGSRLEFLERILSALLWCWFALHITGLWNELMHWLDDIVFIIGAKKVSILAMMQAGISVVITLLLALWGAAVIEQRLMRIEEVHLSFRVVLSRLSRALLMLVAVLVSLSMVGIDLTVLSVFGGALGVGLGFGMQKIASNYVSGFIILFDRSLAIGDMIAVDKFYGRVTKIDTRFTVLRGLDGIESIIPNEMLVSGAVQNHSYSDPHIWVTTDVSVGYDTDIEALLPVLEQATATVPRVSKVRTPAATLVKFGADGLDLRVGFWIDDPENGTGKVLSDVNRAVWKVLQECKIEVPYPQRVVRVLDERPQTTGSAL
ncbi:MAG: mechanosensitive ion channel protein [Burkholderiaceae bacterium]|nr:mechanosensitive ion channel protein [Burkholderiaceae bacterium]